MHIFYFDFIFILPLFFPILAIFSYSIQRNKKAQQKTYCNKIQQEAHNQFSKTNNNIQTNKQQNVTMSNQPKQRIQVPDSLRDILLEFSIAYLLEQPGDVVDYAVEFFTKLQENRKSKISHDDVPPSPDESIMSLDEGKCKFFSFFILDFIL